MGSTCRCSDHTQASIPVMLRGDSGTSIHIGTEGSPSHTDQDRDKKRCPLTLQTPHTPSAFLDLQNGVPAFAILAPSCLHNLVLGLPWQTALHCHFCSGLLHHCCVQHCSNALTLPLFFFKPHQ